MAGSSPPDAPLAGLRLGYALAGDPRDPAIYSGIPASLVAALERGGAEVSALNGNADAPWFRILIRTLSVPRLRPADLRDPRGGVRRAAVQVLSGEPLARVRTRRVARAITAAGPLHGVIHQGTDLLIDADIPTVTLDDVTFAQADAYAWAHVRDASAADRRRWRARADHAYDQAYACAAMTHWTARSLVEDFGVDPARAPVVGVGRNRTLAPPARRDWSVARFLFVGFDFERKNGPRVLAAFAALRERHPEAELHLVGEHPPVDAPGVHGHGVLRLEDAGDRARLQDLYERATCFVMPSLHEPAGIVYTEAGAAGIASIGTTSGGAATIIGDGGVVIDPLDARALLDTMERLADPTEAQRAGALALERSRLFTWDLVAQRLVRALAPAGVDIDALAPFL